MKKVFLLAILLIVVTVTQAQVKIQEGVKYTIQHRNGRVLEIPGGSTNNGANVDLWNNGKSTNQQFTFVTAGDGYWYIKNVKSGKALDIVKGNDKTRTNIQQFAANLSNNQKFKIVDAGSGWMYIVTKNGNYLSSETVHGDNGSNVFLWSKGHVAKWNIYKTQ